MKAYSLSEEDHLKAILHISHRSGKGASTSAIAERLKTKSSSVTAMVKRLSTKGLVDHRPYYGVDLTPTGMEIALMLLRKHRLWETFLVSHLRFKWDEVHELAEQLEHVSSNELTDRLEEFMDHPRFDPHGDPIPDRKGDLPEIKGAMSLSDVPKEGNAYVVGVTNSSDELLKFLDGLGLRIGTQLTVIRKFEHEESLELNTRFRNGITLNRETAEHLRVKLI